MGSRAGTATVLFTDLVGSTDLRRTLGDDRADALRREHDAIVRAAIEEQRGTEVKSTGDGVMAVFASAGEAVAGAAAMQRAIDRFNRRAHHPLGVRIGISAGDVSWEGDDCFGTAVVEARRLCDAADESAILVSDVVRVLAGTRGGHRFASVGTVALKGLGEVAAWEVVWERDPSALVPLPADLAIEAELPMIGRHHERERIERAWKDAAAGTLRLVLIAGEPGVGKTRLTTEAARAAHAQGATVLFGRCDEDLGIPYQPFAEALRGYVLALPLDQLAAQARVVGGEVARLVPALAQRLPSLPDPIRADPETERARLFDGVGAFLDAMAEDAPVVLVLDDVHWATKPTLLLLRHLVRAHASTSALIIATYRDTDLDRGHPLSEVLADLRRESGVERIPLTGLDAAGVTELVAVAAGHELDADAEALALAVHAESEGNPFFVGQILRHLVESGSIVQRDGRWQRTAEGIGIPEGVKEVIGKRLSRFDDRTNEVLAVAAVLGREFDSQLLVEVAGVDGDDVWDALEQAEARRLVLPVPDRPHRRIFQHALVRSTLYDEIPTTRRLRLHRRIGEALERRASAGAAHIEELAHHWCEAAALGDVERALRWTNAAADAAFARLAYEEAAGHYQRALTVLDVDTGAGRAAACELRISYAQAERAAGNVESARAAALRAAGEARGLGRADLLVRAALVVAGDRTWSEAGLVDVELVELLEAGIAGLADDEVSLRARAMARLASELYFLVTEAERRRAMSDEALTLARELGDPATLSYVLGCAVWGSWRPGNSVERRETALEMRDLARAAGNAMLEGAAYSWVVGCCAELGDRAGMDAAIDEEERIATELRHPEYLWGTAVHRAAQALRDGRLDDAERLSTEALERGQSLSMLTAMQMYGVTQFGLRRLRGGLDELEPILQSMVEQYPLLPAWRCGLAYLYRELGRLEDARPAFELLAADDFSVIPEDANWTVGIGVLAMVCASLEDEVRAERLYELLLPMADMMIIAGMPADCVGSVHLPLGLLAAVLERWDAMEEHMARSLQRTMEAGNVPWTTYTKYEHARVLARRGFPGDAERARDLLAACHDEALSVDMPRMLGLIEDLRATYGLANVT